MDGGDRLLIEFRATYLKNSSEHYPGFLRVFEDKVTFITNNKYIAQEYLEIAKSEINDIEKNNSFFLIPNIIKIITSNMQSFRFSLVERDRLLEAFK